MKITKVETIRLRSRATLIWVRIHTDEGIIGLGESWFGCAAIEADIHDRVAPALLGQDPSRIEALNRQMRPYVGFGKVEHINPNNMSSKGPLVTPAVFLFG